MEGTNGGAKLLQVKVISKEMVKPSSPTPSNLETLELSCIDQEIPIFPPRLMTPIFLFYTATPETQPVDVAGLKASLSRALTVYYPLAGRAKQSTITCNDEGIPFIEAQVDCPLSTLLFSAPKFDVLSKLLPPLESLGVIENQPFTEVINISIQINIFTCGGVVLTWYDIHKINDGVSSANFFKHWAAIASKRDDDPTLIIPNYDIASTTFPPVPIAESVSVENIDKSIQQHCSIVVKSFRFSNTAISKLKPKAASNHVLNPSRFLTVTGFVWEQALASKTAQAPISGNNDQKTALILSMDMRPRLTPPLPQGTMGNLFTAQVISADLGAQLPDLVAEIYYAVGKKKDEIKEYGIGNGVNPMRENLRKVLGTVKEYKDRAYTLTSWCKIGFSNLDFGFGKPKWAIPTDGKIHCHSRSFVLMDYSDSNDEGIEAWLFLEEKEMETLESNAEFLAFASPVF